LNGKYYTILNYLNVCRYSYGIYYYGSSNNTIKSLSTSGNSEGGVYNNTGVNYLFNAKIQEATEVAGFLNFANSRIFSQNHDQIADNH